MSRKVSFTEDGSEYESQHFAFGSQGFGGGTKYPQINSIGRFSMPTEEVSVLASRGSDVGPRREYTDTGRLPRLKTPDIVSMNLKKKRKHALY